MQKGSSPHKFPISGGFQASSKSEVALKNHNTQNKMSHLRILWCRCCCGAGKSAKAWEISPCRVERGKYVVVRTHHGCMMLYDIVAFLPAAGNCFDSCT